MNLTLFYTHFITKLRKDLSYEVDDRSIEPVLLNIKAHFGIENHSNIRVRFGGTLIALITLIEHLNVIELDSMHRANRTVYFKSIPLHSPGLFEEVNNALQPILNHYRITGRP